MTPTLDQRRAVLQALVRAYNQEAQGAAPLLHLVTTDVLR